MSNRIIPRHLRARGEGSHAIYPDVVLRLETLGNQLRQMNEAERREVAEFVHASLERQDKLSDALERLARR